MPKIGKKRKAQLASLSSEMSTFIPSWWKYIGMFLLKSYMAKYVKNLKYAHIFQVSISFPNNLS